MDKLKAGIWVASWIIFWVQWLVVILLLLVERDKNEENKY